ncbi:hypothetical protein EX30DRAFT_365092 [Ascodesmis nigricans]|uniref:GDP-mannose transporter n=1 Tax=Ascodesmis nigricans TaxID=341454 RepID=A0A4V3SIC4_9PEZI|nr:hypothetical protein EX30DRAFT_365092 [Ascodesmis nigricans]
MHRSPFANFPRPHELLSTAKAVLPTAADVANTFAHSRNRNRSSGGASMDSVFFEAADTPDEERPARPWSRTSHSRSRSSSPVKISNAGSVPLLPLHDRSRSITPETAAEWRIGEGASEERSWTGGWSEGRKLGWWLWSTERGWGVYIGFLVALYAFASLALVIMNRFLLWTGVYKFPYPITTIFLELLFTQFFLVLSASLTRSFARSLHSFGLGCIVAPNAKPGKGKRRAGSSGLRDFATQVVRGTSGGVFEVKWAEAKPILPLAVIYSLKIMLTNISFGYTQLQIYQSSRVPALIMCLLLTHYLCRNQSLTITTLSSCIVMVLSLTMVSLRPGIRFAIEGFLSGLFSNLFVAAYPIFLARTWKIFNQCNNSTVSDFHSAGNTTQEEARSAWKLLHYVNFMAILIVFPFVLLSGEMRDISRNCYILDVAFFWLMLVGAGAAAWATFVSGFLLVRATTPLTMVVTTYPRSALQTMLLVGFKLPTWSWVGVLTCWGSSVWYLLGRRRECGISFFSVGDDDDVLGRRSRNRST